MKIILTLFILTGILFGQVKGIVVDKETGEPLPYASIFVPEVNQGTVTNLEGRFSLKLDPGKYSLNIRFLGYKSDSLKITAPFTKLLQIELEKQPILLAEVIVTDEDPAYRIIRQAIANKKSNKAGLNNIEYDVYSKKVLTSAGEVASVDETYAKGYSKPNDWAKEFIYKKYVTENRKTNSGNINFNTGKTYYIDFSDDTLNVMMNRVHLPLSVDAFDHYDYKLLQTMDYGTFKVYKIRVIPKSDIRPLLKGEITIESSKYSLASVDLESGKGLRFPYVNDLVFKFKQSLGQIGKYWLPNYVELYASLEVNFSGLLGIEPISFHQINNITGYQINRTVPDSVLKAVYSRDRGWASDTSKAKVKPFELTKEMADSLRPIALTQSEVKAYKELDSTKTFDKMIKPTGALSSLVKVGENNREDSSPTLLGTISGYLFDYIYLSNNRAEGLAAGIRFNKKIGNLTTNNYLAYSANQKQAVFNSEFIYRLKKSFVDRISLNVFHKITRWQEYTPTPEIINSASVLLGFEDLWNYYKTTGVKLNFQKTFSRNISATIGYSFEQQKNPNKLAVYSFFKNRNVRINPLINEGNDSKITLNALIGADPFEIKIRPEDGVLIASELSSKILGSDFEYQKIYLTGSYFIPTFFKELFVYPYLTFNFSAAAVTGNYGIQHLMTPEATVGFFNFPGSAKGIKPYDFAGDKFVQLQLEHNWRTIIFQGLGLDFLTDLNLDIITGAGYLKVWNDSKLNNNIWKTKDYWEVYGGIARILGIIQLNCGYNSEKDTFFRATASVLF